MGDRERAVGDAPRPLILAGVVLGLWALALVGVPLAVGLLVHAEPLRLVASGIQWDYGAVTLAGYRAIAWSSIIVAALGYWLGARRPVSALRVVLALHGAALAATLLLMGGGFNIGPGAGVLVGTELRWVWRFVLGVVGVMVGLVGPAFLLAEAGDLDQDHGAAIRRSLQAGALLAAALILLLPGSLTGKLLTAAASYGGSLVWLVGAAGRGDRPA